MEHVIKLLMEALFCKQNRQGLKDDTPIKVRWKTGYKSKTLKKIISFKIHKCLSDVCCHLRC